jgi:formate--tetrahydrofolate ligase
MRKFGLPVVVAVNHFKGDTAAEFARIETACAAIGVQAVPCTHWAEGGKGALALADAVTNAAGGAETFTPFYPADLPLAEKIRRIATGIYGAGSVTFDSAASAQLARFEAAGFGRLPVCMAKTQYSFSTDPAAKGAPGGFALNVREARLSAGAGFVVALCGEVLTMPGLPRHPAAFEMFVTADGEIGGLS